MTSIKISKVHYEMLVEYCKRKRRNKYQRLLMLLNIQSGILMKQLINLT